MEREKEIVREKQIGEKQTLQPASDASRVRIGISGGTFDPIHLGHLIIAENIRESMSLAKIIFIPTGRPPHKNIAEVTDAIHRYNMVCKAIRGNPFFEVSRMEIDRPGYTYTVDTLRELRQVYGDGARLFFITGADIIPELPTWKEFEKIFSMCEIVAVLRPGYERSEIAKEITKLEKGYKARIYIVDAPLIGISSTWIRQNIKEGKSIRYLVPAEVEEYIRTNGLYGWGRAYDH